MKKNNNCWQVKVLEDVVETIFSGGTPNTKENTYWNGSFPWLSSGETKNRFIVTTEKTVTEEGIRNSSTRLAKAGDIVIASAGQGLTRGQTSYLKIDTYINQSVIAIRANSEVINPLLLFYDLRNRYEELRQISDSHSSRGSLTTTLLKQLEIRVPPKEIQIQMVPVLESINLKIEANSRQNQTLEALGQTLFKSWKSHP